jgi:hypothetical protein
MRRRAFTVLATALAIALAAVGLAACGGSSSSVKIPGEAPTGSTTYHGDGFMVSFPRGWRRFDAGATGHAVVQWSNASDTGLIDVTVRSGIYRTPTTDLLKEAKLVNSTAAASIKMSSITLSSASVPGASRAELLTERGSTAKGPHLIEDLIVTTQSGIQIEVTATQRAGAGGFDPTSYVNSFALGSSA